MLQVLRVERQAVSSVGSADEPLGVRDAVQRDEGDEDWGVLGVVLVLRVAAILLVLAQFKATRAAEHDPADAQVPADGGDPLPCAAEDGDTGDEDAGPRDDFTEIIGATHQAEQAHVAEAVRMLLLEAVLGQVGCGFEQDAGAHDRRTHNGHGVGARMVLQAECDRGGLACVEQRATHPGEELEGELHMLPVVNRLLHDLMVGGAAVLACEQIAAKPQAIDNKERRHHNRHGGQAAGDTEVDEQRRADAGDREAVANRDEPDVPVETDGADCERHKKDNQKCHIPSVSEHAGVLVVCGE